eukprot:CAMPEP_0196129446 /NCGR_PEP_ID=MMETSP0910-20130528/65_1 /TAXON_ID=49265 /ORGANISM="Thalassiosira rotula, Strain GSO102" /LENGTH=69 /DNA_ID=CAMNT_0041388537 /DNA_START=1 /DNA_END=210 /DNA_ORIENTATION=+
MSLDGPINKETGRTPPPNAPRGPAVLGIGAKTMESTTVVVAGLESVGGSVSKCRTVPPWLANVTRWTHQ